MLEPHERALSLVGVPFRFQGRDPLIGLDCLGLVLSAFDLIVVEPPTYRVSDGNWSQVETELAQWFARGARTIPKTNDLAVFKLPRCFHFGVISNGFLVHADIVAGKVVSRKMPTRLSGDCRLYTHCGEAE